MSNMDNLPIPPERLLAAMRLLVDAFNCARDVGCDREQFAVEAKTLWLSGLSPETLRWLCKIGHARHLIETTTPGDLQRSFDEVPPTVLQDRSCCVLTDGGVDFAVSIISHFSVDSPSPETPENRPHSTYPEKPTNGHTPDWDDQKSELSIGGALVKRLNSRATNQRLILRSLQEEGWPRRIDDPLPPGPPGDRTKRLRSAVGKLCKGHYFAAIQFSSEDTSVSWCLIHSNENADLKGRPHSASSDAAHGAENNP